MYFTKVSGKYWASCKKRNEVVLMTKKKAYLVIQAAALIVLVLLLSLKTVSIYREGQVRKAENPLESVYTPEIVAEKFAPVAPLFFGLLGMTLAGLLLGVKDEEAEKPVKDAEAGRDLIVSRVGTPSEEMKREQAVQKKLQVTGWAVFALCMIPIVIFLCDPAHFPQEDYDSMLFGLLRVLVPCTCAGLTALAVTFVMRDKSIQREIRAAQAVLKEEKAAEKTPGQAKAAAIPGVGEVSGAAGAEASAGAREAVGTKGAAGAEVSAGAAKNSGLGNTDKMKKHKTIQAVIVVAAVVLIVAGILNFSARDVLYKAISICTECVGLG